MERELVSVIIPIYNEYKYLKKSIESILRQTYQNIEIIIIDSSDDTNKTKSLIHLEDQRIRYYYRERNGLADALNYGIKNANGNYIARMDADDISEVNRIEKQVEFFKKSADISVLGTSFEIIDENDQVKSLVNAPVSHDEIFAKLLFENPMCHPSIMFRKQVFSDGNRYRSVFSEDYDLWTRLILKYKFANLPEILFKYRVHETNLSIIGGEKVEKSVCKSTKDFFKQILGRIDEENEDVDFFKNDRIQWCESRIIEGKDEFFFRQFKLIEQLQKVNSNKHWANENIWNKELNKRWKLLWRLTSVIQIQTHNIIDNFGSTMDWDVVKREYLLNEKMVQSELTKKKYIYLYGCGIRGKDTLQKLENIKDDFRWGLLGVIDQKERIYYFNGEKKSTISVDQIDFQRCDFILISSKLYYEDIRNRLISMGVHPKKILSDSMIYYIK